MTTTYFFLPRENIHNNIAEFDLEESHHIIKSLRAKIGNIITAVDGKGNEIKVKIKEINKIAKGEIIETKKSENEINAHIDIAIGLIKGKRMDWAIEKVVELGVKNIIPFMSKYTIDKIPINKKGIGAKELRWRKIAISAMKQSKRAYLPNISRPINIDELIDTFDNYNKVLLASQDGIEIKSVLNTQSFNNNKILLIVGSEGGFSDDEVAKVIENGAVLVSLGRTRLRTETATVAIAALVINSSNLHLSQ